MQRGRTPKIRSLVLAHQASNRTMGQSDIDGCGGTLRPRLEMQVLKVRAGFDSTPGHQYLVPFDPIRVSHLKLFSLRQSTLRIRGANNHLVVKLPTARLFPGRCLLATEAGHLDAASRFFAR
jgi:hypothetical protein